MWDTSDVEDYEFTDGRHKYWKLASVKTELNFKMEEIFST